MPRLSGNSARLLAIAALLVLALVASPRVQTGVHTALFVLQVLDVPYQPQQWLTGEPVRQEVEFPAAEGSRSGDIYRVPGDGERPGVLIFLGANAAGRDDPDVVNLGNSLSRAGFAVMFYWSPTMGLQSNIDPGEIENLVRAFMFLRGQSYVDPGRVGMGGFSVGGGFALVAAADPRIREEVAFVNAFGPYYDIGDLALQVVSHTTFFEGEREPWQPDPLTVEVLANEMIESVDNPQERELLRGIHLEGEAVSEARLEELSPQARRVRQMLEGVDLETARMLYQQLPAGLHQQGVRISPRHHLAGLEATVMVMHDRNDRLIPVAESRRLAQALEDREGFRYTEFVTFDHVRPGTGGGIWQVAKEGFKLYRHLYGIIRVTR